MQHRTSHFVLYGLMMLGMLILVIGSILGGTDASIETVPSVSVMLPEAEGMPVVAQTPIPRVVTEEERIAFFNDAVFVGDSITLKLKNYSAQKGDLGQAHFLCSGNFGVNHGVKGSLQVSYGDQEWLVEDAIRESGKKKAFFMLGINDIALYGLDTTMENWATLVNKVREKNPDLSFYVQSISPIYRGAEKKNLTMPIINKYNERLSAFCAEKGLEYVDVSSTLKEGSGYLKNEYCSDEFIHLTDAGCEAWVGLLHQKANQWMGGMEPEVGEG